MLEKETEEQEADKWLSQIAEGSAAAFVQFYDAYAPMVYRIAVQLTKDAAEAEDVCQDIFIEVMHKAGQYDAARGSVEAWLTVKTKSRVFDRLRKRKRCQLADWGEEVLDDLLIPEQGNDPVEMRALQRLELEQVKKALLDIPPLQRMAVYGCYVEQFSHQELAKIMNKPIGTVKSLIRYGIRNMKKQLLGQVEVQREEGKVLCEVT